MSNTPCILKVTGLSGEKEHYINLNLCDRTTLTKLSNCTAYRLYVHSYCGDLDIAISEAEAIKVRKALEVWM